MEQIYLGYLLLEVSFLAFGEVRLDLSRALEAPVHSSESSDVRFPTVNSGCCSIFRHRALSQVTRLSVETLLPHTSTPDWVAQSERQRK